MFCFLTFNREQNVSHPAVYLWLLFGCIIISECGFLLLQNQMLHPIKIQLSFPCQLSCEKGCLLLAMHSATLLFSYFKNKSKNIRRHTIMGCLPLSQLQVFLCQSHKVGGPGFAGEALLGKWTPLFHTFIPFQVRPPSRLLHSHLFRYKF